MYEAYIGEVALPN